MIKEHHGVVVPMASPFTEDGRLDEPAVVRLLDHILRAGVAGVLVLGTTGEAMSIPARDRLRLAELATAEIDGRARVYVNISDNSFRDAVDYAADYASLGADALVAHLPFYYPLGGAEMRMWYERLADAVPRPLLLYNIPMTTGLSIPEEVVEALSHHENVVGMKDSEYDAARMERLVPSFSPREDFSYFAGPSVWAKRAMELGADGFVPGVGNVLPHACQALYQAARDSDWSTADRAQERMKAIGDTYQSGRPVTHGVAMLKTALHALGLCEPWVLPPLLLPPADERREVAAAVSRVVDGAVAEV